MKPKTVLLEVTNADILAADKARAEGRRGTSDCPLAQSLARSFGVDNETVSAHPNFLRVRTPDHLYIFKASLALREYMRRFDNFKQVKPHRFLLKPY